ASIAQAVATALGVREAGTQRLQDALAQHLQAKHLLLVLDDGEHLLVDIRVLVERWLRLAPGLRILATSREALGVPNEVVYRVPPLGVPAFTLRALNPRVYTEERLGEIARVESVRLFCDRASAVLPTFELSAETAPFVAGICRRLDGLPLAIELAAARMNVLSAEQIYRRLDAALSLLTRGGSVALPHQETLQATLEWGHGLLSASERVLFRRLAVFAGSFDLQAIEALCDIPSVAVLDLLSNLVDKSLVQSAPTANVMRYRLLEVVRQFGWVKLRDAGEEQALCLRHRDYYVQWAEHGEPELRGARQLDWFAQFEYEHDNLRAALEFCQQSGDAENGLRLAAALWWFWRARGYLSEGRARIAQLLTLPDASVSPSVHARALNTAGFLALFQGDFPTARQHAQAALDIAEKVEDKQAMAMALYILGDDVVAESVARGIAIRQQSLALSEEIGDKWMTAFTLNSLGELARLQDDYAAARAHYERALEIRREIQDQRGIAVCLNNLGFVAYHQGQVEPALDLMRQALATFWELQSVVGVAETLVGMVGAMVERGDRDAIRHAARWLGGLSAQLEDIWTPLTGADRRELEMVTARVRACLGEADLQRALAEGRQLSLEQIVTDALGCSPPPPIV
ncbi:MAG: tetratricopeptide repeat protein, partial [Anaerolineae bacterium]|nr:tetratricopeptide repeat protein [Anaerolineae bacterium]